MASFKLKLVVWFALLALLPLGIAFYGYGTLARQSETRRADASLEAALRAAVAGYADRLDAASSRATSLAAAPALQHALRLRDRAALAKLVAKTPGASVTAGSLHVGSTRSPAAVRTVTVVDRGRLLGHVSVRVAIDDSLLASLGTGLAPGDRLVAVAAGRIVAGPARGSPLALQPGNPQRTRIANTDYRGLITEPVSVPHGLALAALTPQHEIDVAARSSRSRVLIALLASLAFFALVTYLLGRSVVGTLRRLADAARAIAGGRFDERVEVGGHDEFAQLGHAFNEMAAQLERRLAELQTERSRVRGAIARFGEALAATHEPDHLLRVVVESVVEATGAAGGIVRERGIEVVRAGDPEAPGRRVAFPLRAGPADFGSLELVGAQLEPRQIETAAALVGQAVVALENARLHRLVEEQARVDSLTDLANRRRLEETLRSELARAARFGGDLTFVLADLDNFKQVNDRYGHPAGDEVLQAFARVLEGAVRESDVAGRWGGEEFALVLTGTDAEGGAQLAERARVAFEAMRLRTPAGESLPVTASFGVAASAGNAEFETLVAAADSALYRAKRAGKNRVETAGAEPA
jgi:diguanylate cyclase (GGDEF)-like protein